MGGPCEVLMWREPESLVIQELEVEPEYIVGVRGWSQRLWFQSQRLWCQSQRLWCLSQRLWFRSQRLWYHCDYCVTPVSIGLGFGTA